MWQATALDGNTRQVNLPKVHAAASKGLRVHAMAYGSVRPGTPDVAGVMVAERTNLVFAGF